MDFKDLIFQLQERILKLRSNIGTEEATKNAFIMPFLSALGYDVFNPMEVVPEYTCDIGTKKGEKIDYAIIKDGEPIILIECKHCEQNLNLHDNQLLRYFNVSKAKFGVLTNGLLYRFYTDLEKPNVMDEKPFLEVNLLDLKDNHIEELRKFHKSYFDVANIMATANDLKYTSELKGQVLSEFSNPSPEFVKFFAKQVYDGMITPKILEQFTQLTKRSIQQVISDSINDRLKAALNKVDPTDADKEISQPDTSAPLVVTTGEELQGFYIIRGILAREIPIERITQRDAQTYFAILLDDNNRKPLCRLYFNSSNKYLATFDDQKKESKHLLESLNDLYNYADLLMETVKYYEEK